MASPYDLPVPAPLRERAVAWLGATGDRPEPAPAKLAATVLLLRESAGAAEVFMQRRVSSMAFAPSMWVFPGGGVDAGDHGETPWAGPAAAEWGRLLGMADTSAAAVVVAAARELFEECGVLLAGPSADTVVGAGDEQWASDRHDLLERRVTFGELLHRRGLLLRSDLLAVQDHWVTPQMEPKRYDTWFFAAVLPSGQAADDGTSEAEIAQWRCPAHVLAEERAGEARMFPPTRIQLSRLAAGGGLTRFTAHRRGLRPVMPEPVRVGDELVLRARLNDEPEPGDDAGC